MKKQSLGLLFILLNTLTATQVRAQNSSADSKSYVLPAFEIVGFQILLNQYDRHFAQDKEAYESDLHTIKNNIRDGFGFDRDSFNINQIGHPYQGSIYYGLARSAGLNFWESFGYTSAGSLLWEIAGENTRPSTNDQITTSVGGSLLGEALFRTAETFWPRTQEEKKNDASTVGATIASPAAEFNRLAFDKKVSPDTSLQRPIVFRELDVGARHYSNLYNSDAISTGDRTKGSLGFDIEYGLPGKSGYEYRRPFDYFNLDAEFVTSNSDPVDHIMVNGLLWGQKYASTDSVRGVYGIYGSYNYFAPEIYRVSSSGLSIGSTAQWFIDNSLTLQGTTLGGVGFGAAGTIRDTDGVHDYHYGAVPQASLALKLILDDCFSINISGQDYLVAGASAEPGGSGNENITRLEVGMTARVWRSHAVSLEYGASQRNAAFDRTPDQHQRIETVSIFYSYLWGGTLSGTAALH